MRRGRNRNGLFTSTAERMKVGAPKRCSKTMEKGTPEWNATAALRSVAKGALTSDQLDGLDESSVPTATVEELFALSAFCIAAGNSATAHEKSFMSCFRLSLQGAQLISGGLLTDAIVPRTSNNILFSGCTSVVRANTVLIARPPGLRRVSAGLCRAFAGPLPGLWAQAGFQAGPQAMVQAKPQARLARLCLRLCLRLQFAIVGSSARALRSRAGTRTVAAAKFMDVAKAMRGATNGEADVSNTKVWGTSTR